MTTQLRAYCATRRFPRCCHARHARPVGRSSARADHVGEFHIRLRRTKPRFGCAPRPQGASPHWSARLSGKRAFGLSAVRLHSPSNRPWLAHLLRGRRDCRHEDSWRHSHRRLLIPFSSLLVPFCAQRFCPVVRCSAGTLYRTLVLAASFSAHRRQSISVDLVGARMTLWVSLRAPVAAGVSQRSAPYRPGCTLGQTRGSSLDICACDVAPNSLRDGLDGMLRRRASLSALGSRFERIISV